MGQKSEMSSAVCHHYSLHAVKFFRMFCHMLLFFKIDFFQKNISGISMRVSNILD